MRLASVSGRLSLLTAREEVVDIERATGDRFGPGIQSAYERWGELLDVASGLAAPGEAADWAEFGNPAPARQVFAIGLNYAGHASEASFSAVEPTRWTRSAAGSTSVGQDISERDLQRVVLVRQFSLAKSHPGFGPIGPVLMTPDELDAPDDLELGSLVNGERTRDMVFSVGELIAQLSAVAPLLTATSSSPARRQALGSAGPRRVPCPLVMSS